MKKKFICSQDYLLCVYSKYISETILSIASEDILFLWRSILAAIGLRCVGIFPLYLFPMNLLMHKLIPSIRTSLSYLFRNISIIWKTDLLLFSCVEDTYAEKGKILYICIYCTNTHIYTQIQGICIIPEVWYLGGNVEFYITQRSSYI